MISLETAPPAQERRRERRWTIISLGLVACTLAGAALAVNTLRKTRPAQAAPVDHGPLPAAVRTEVLAVLNQHLLDARLEEYAQEGLREFHIKGRTRAGLAQEFYAGFRPAVVGRLMPLLRPYGEVISFDIASLDLPPARLRPLPPPTKD
jgi:hypothetical protein